ncbi:efflux RND transporter permease subunit [Hoeflea sp. YIM 152468]|uniref:efflux RND transporter permease subunit n=1 Tax=Hoeflea sp. YIM 152468 TaxID=3031759 RepID=UPI0023D99F59|nr:efflux RND transporter permease subunit [Hoeflea sp. YIM 152468]MDF1608873.1 efflux RND transporter permease subunit [Hoeflea sp. YIM 152468]
MEALTQFGMHRSRFTVLAMIAVLLMGLFAYGALPKRENPSITIRTAIVSAQFPGMSPERVEDLLAAPLERAAREITEVEDISTLITTGTVTLWVAMYDSVSGTDLDTAFQDLRTRMEEEALTLPEGTRGPFLNTNYGDVAIATIAVTGDGFTLPEIENAAADLQQGLYDLDGVTKVTLSGEQDERIWLEIDSRRLAAVGVQIPQILADLADQNVILPAGEIDAGGQSIVLEANGNLKSIEEIENVLTRVSGLDGAVRLRDLMNVRRGIVDPPQEPVYFDGEPAVLVSVEMADDRDIQKLGRELRQAIVDLEQQQPIGVRYNISTFQEANVTIAVNSALSNVGQTFVVVLIVMVIFLGLRPAIVIACIVPFTIMIALLLMSRFGIDLEQVSIAAVIISLGLLVDNGLVIVDDIQSRIDGGAAPREAAIGAGGQFFMPLAVASVTTVSAFIPMLILEGSTGEFAFSLGAVVAMMLAGSWLAAHYFLPFLAATLLRKKNTSGEEGRMVRVYGDFVRRCLPLGIPVILASYGLVVIGGMAFGLLKSEMFPLSERAEFLIYLDMPKGTAITATRDEALSIDTWLRDQGINPEIKNTTTFVGHGGPRFYLALSPANTDPSSAFILVNTTSYQGAVEAAERARGYLFESRPAARARVTRLSMGGGESGIVEVQIKGPDANAMLAAAKSVEAAYAEVPGIVLNENDWGNKVIKVVVDVAQDKARELGVTSRGISDVLNTYFSGTTYSTFRDGPDSIPIVLRAEPGFRDSLEDIANLSIPVDAGLIALDQIATFRPRLEFSQLRRQNQVRQIVISGKSAILSAREVEEAIQPTLESLDLGPDYQVEIGGETADSAETNAKLAAGMPLALIVMIAALVFQFNSARRVMLTFMTIPLIIIGAPLALFVTGQPLSFFAILGLISLMGIIINNAIVLIDQIDIERQTLDRDAAIVAAARKRLRPVLLTSLTTVLGLLPMALFGGALFEPMATLMIGGLLLASPLTLLFVPCGYRLMFAQTRKRALPEIPQIG